MAGDNRQEAYLHLLNLAAQQGYVVFDDIIDAAERWELPLDEVDWLSNSITTRGILVYDEAPGKRNRVSTDDEYDDYAQIDYDAIFDRIIELDPSLTAFVKDVREIRPPQFREMGSIVYQAKEGNLHARERIVEMHLRMALRIGLQRAEQYDADVAECIGDACVGLIIATDKYDPDTSGPFGSYASLWMLQNVSREQQTKRPEVYYPVHKKEPYFTMYPILKEHGCTNCDEIWQCTKVRELIAERLSLADDQIDDIIMQTQPFESLDDLLQNTADVFEKQGEDVFQIHLTRDAHRLYEKLTAENTFFSAITEQQTKNIVDSVLKTLSDRQERVIRDRFGFAKGREMTLEEIGNDLGITRERVRQIEKKAIDKLSSSKKLRELI